MPPRPHDPPSTAGSPSDYPGARVVHVVISVEHGGAERVVLDLASAQQRAGMQPSVVCLRTAGALAPLFAAQGIPVEVLAGSPRGVLPTAWALAKALRSLAPQIVHAHNVSAQVAVALSRKLMPWSANRARLVYTEHGKLSDARRSLLMLRRWLGRAFDAVIGVSKDVDAQLRLLRIGRADRHHVVLNGVDPARFPPRSARAPGDPLRLVSVGRLSHVKGQDVLVDAMATALKADPTLALVLVGAGPTRAALEAQCATLGIAGRIQFAGAQQDVRPFLEAADLFVLPSRSEGISVALLEAMAAGLPVVATRVGGTPEVMGPGSGGLLVEPERPDALAEAILTFSADRDLLAREGRAARSRVAAAFSLDNTVAAYTACYGLSAPRAAAVPA